MNKMVEIDGDSLPLARFDRGALMALRACDALPIDGRVEMIDGVLIEMSPVHHAHARTLTCMIVALGSRMDASNTLLTDASIYLADDLMLTPDLVVLPDGVLSHDATGGDLKLVVEVSDATLRRDLGPKAKDYSRYDVREYWVVDVDDRKVHIHRHPGQGGYRTITVQDWADPITALLLPDLALTLADILAP